MSAATEPETCLLKSIGSTRLLPTVGTHERPLSVEQLHQRFSNPEDAALFLLLTCWDDALCAQVATCSGSDATGEEELARRHYRAVWRKAMDADDDGLKARVVALLQQVGDASGSNDEGSQLSACVTLASTRACFALAAIEATQGDGRGPTTLTPETQAYVSAIADAVVGPNSASILRPQWLATEPRNDASGVAQAVAAYTVLLLTEYRSCKQAAARKWVAFARHCCHGAAAATNKNTDEASPQKASPLSALDVCGVGLCASLSLCIPTGRASVQQSVPPLPLLSPSFVALFWTFVVEHLSALMAGPGDCGSALVAATPVQCLVEAFGCALQLHLGRVDGSAKAKTNGVLVGVSCIEGGGDYSTSGSKGLPPAAYDAFFGVFMPTVVQQLGFEFPWSSFVRLGRAAVNEGKQRAAASASSSDAAALSARCDRCWLDVLQCLALRSYRERLAQALPSSLGGYLHDAFVLSDAIARKNSNNNTTITKVQLLNDLAKDVSLKLSTTVDRDAALSVVEVAMHAIDALPFVVQLRSKSSSSSFMVNNERLVCLLWLLLCTTNHLTVRGHYQHLFQSLFANRVASMRGGVDAASEFSQKRRPSPFAEVAKLWLASLLSQQQPNDEQPASPTAVLLREAIGARMLRFMSACYLPVTQVEGQRSSSLGLAITVRDVIDVCRFAMGSPDGDAEATASSPSGNAAAAASWASAPSEVRMLMRGITARIIDVRRRTAASPCPAMGALLDDVDANLLGLEWEQWEQYLQDVTHCLPRRSSSSGRWVSPVWVPPTAVTQASLQRQ